MKITDKIMQAKADTIVRVNNTIYGKITDAPDSPWRSAFGIKHANAFITICAQADKVEFLNEVQVEEPKPVKKARHKEIIPDVNTENESEITNEY